jgi:catecholate siderophore receptor
VNEDARVFRKGNEYQAISAGVYAQDMVHITPTWKLLGGLRFDMLRGNYTTFAIPAAAAGPVTATSYQQDIANWSPRLGALYQPDARTTWHVSYGTSFNTSGDAYSYNALSANTPPEKSSNFEIGGRFDSADKLSTTRFALFHTVKENERNTDPDTAATRLLLSGRRHATGIELDWTGRITPKWEIYTSYMWMPDAAVDVAASTATTAGNRAGDRPGLTPVHSGTVWTTYQLDPKWRVGGGLNFRSSQAPADTTPPAWEVPGYMTVDLMTEYRIDHRWTLKANISNAGDVLYADSLYRGHYVPGAGRLMQVSLTARF